MRKKETLSKFYAIRLPEKLWLAVMAAGPNKVREVLEKMIGGKRDGSWSSLFNWKRPEEK
mgnify:CR=1 FL=1